MTEKEAKRAFEEMRKAGADDNAILGTLYSLFQDDKIDINELGALVNVLGYELTEEFKNMSPEDQKVKGYEENPADDSAEEDGVKNDEELNRIKGCMFGGAIGDALGYPVEFMSYDSIRRKYGERGIESYDLCGGKALVSDDTQMTLFTAQGLLNGEADGEITTEKIYFAYLDWLKTQGYSVKCGYKGKYRLSDCKDLNYSRAPGNTCLTALSSGSMGVRKNRINTSKGCGGVMRVAPIGLFIDKFDGDFDKVAFFAADAAAITHGHELGYIPAAALAYIVAKLYKGAELIDAIENCIKAIDKLFPNAWHLKEFDDIMRKAIDLSAQDYEDEYAINRIGQGWVGEEALAIAVYCALKYKNDFKKAICAAVNHGGDSDSTGAIAGNISGTYLGYKKIPAEYLDDIELKDLLNKISHDLAF